MNVTTNEEEKQGPFSTKYGNVL